MRKAGNLILIIAMLAIAGCSTSPKPAAAGDAVTIEMHPIKYAPEKPLTTQ
jgi:hypothetical protein